MFESIPGRRVAVTGGLGFIGSNLVIELVRLGAQVVIVDLPEVDPGANLFNIAPVRNDVQVLQIDVRDAQRLSAVVEQQEFFFCLAGQVSHPVSMRQPLLDLDVNCRSCLSLLELCRSRNPDIRLLHASTRQLYGRPQYLPVDERHVVRPVDVNGVSKLAAEQLFRLYWENYGIRSVSLRLTNTYGPRMDLRNPDKGFAGVFLARALNGQQITVFGSGEQRRDFLHVSDVVQAMLLAITAESTYGMALNLAHPEHYSLNQFIEILGQSLPVAAVSVEFPPERQAIDLGDYYGCSRLFQEHTGWEPRLNLTAGLRQTVEYFREHRQHYL